MFNYLINVVKAQPTPPQTAGGISDIDSIYDLFVTGLNWFFGFAIVLAIIILIASGIQWMTAGGNDESRKSALSRIYYVVAGVAIIVLAWVIVTQVIPAFFGVADISV